jgi:glycosyltransferase involved in cell wall biosynthesis
VTLLYFADTRFPIERANGWQTMATCHALASRGHDVTLVVRPDTASPARDPFVFYGLPRLSALHIRASGPASTERGRRMQYLFGALRLAATERHAIVYTRDLGLAALLLQLPRIRRPRVAYESHGIAPIVSEEMPRLLGQPDRAPTPRKIDRLDRRERRVWRHADVYVTITRALADDLAARYGGRDRVRVVPDGARLDPPLPAPPAGAPPTAAYAGHLYPWKGVDVLVRALALTPRVRGLIVGGHPGESDRARVDALIASLGLTDRVTVTGLVPLAEVRARLAPATMLVLPNVSSSISERYTSPLKLFEYLTMGRPIVASDLASIREVLTAERTALLVPPDDPRALAAAFDRLVDAPALANNLASAASQLAPEFSWDKRAERLEAAIAEAAR